MQIQPARSQSQLHKLVLMINLQCTFGRLGCSFSVGNNATALCSELQNQWTRSLSIKTRRWWQL